MTHPRILHRFFIFSLAVILTAFLFTACGTMDEKTAQHLALAAEQGNAEAQFDLGNCYCKGEGVEQDKAEAVKWYRKAAEQDFDLAITALERLEENESRAVPDAG